MTRAAPPLPVVLRDSREQEPLSPYRYRIVDGVAQRLRFPTRDVALESGDYSLPGLEKIVAVERKSCPDLWGTLFGRDIDSSVGEARRSVDRFRREMGRMFWLARRWILVEGSKASLMAYARERHAANGERGRSPEENTNSLLDMLAAIEVDYGVTVVWAGGREGAEAWLGRILWRIWDQHTGGEKARTARSRGLGIEELPWLAEETSGHGTAAARGLWEPQDEGSNPSAQTEPVSARRRFAEAGGMPLSHSAAERARLAARRTR